MRSFPHWGPDCRDAIGRRQGTLLLIGIERLTHDVRAKFYRPSGPMSFSSQLHLAMDATAFFFS